MFENNDEESPDDMMEEAVNDSELGYYGNESVDISPSANLDGSIYSQIFSNASEVKEKTSVCIQDFEETELFTYNRTETSKQHKSFSINHQNSRAQGGHMF